MSGYGQCWEDKRNECRTHHHECIHTKNMKETLLDIESFDDVNQASKITKESNCWEDKYDYVIQKKSFHRWLQGCLHGQWERETDEHLEVSSGALFLGVLREE